MAPQNIQYSQPGVWTEQRSQEFYREIQALQKQLKGGQSPEEPRDYRKIVHTGSYPEAYSLSYDEELHLADDFAFIAHAVSDDNEYVSAVTLQEQRNPPGYIVKLASNRTPKQYVQVGLSCICNIIKEHAEAGRDGEGFKTKLFHEVVKLNRQRIYGRIRTSQWIIPARLRGRQRPSLHSMIDRELAMILAPSPHMQADVATLRLDLMDLRDALERVDRGPPSDQISLLEEAILKSHRVSNQGGSKSLEDRLHRVGFGTSLCKSPQVSKIDKLSKYWQCCIDFIRFSRDPKTRPLCKNIKLEVCDAPATGKPAGFQERCYVHGEVQLALFHDRYPTELPPRALGSSKSACFLCDLFIKHHGKLGMSHSHMKLYSKWMIPQCDWASKKQRKRLVGVVMAMTSDIQQYENRGTYYMHMNAESMAHIPRFEKSSEMAPSDMSISLEVLESVDAPCIVVQKSIEGAMSTARLISNSALDNTEDIHHHFIELPVHVSITPSTKSCTILNNKDGFYFDLEEIQHGKLYISESRDGDEDEKSQRVDIGDLRWDSLICIRPSSSSHNLVFDILNTLHSGLRVDIVWEDLSGM